MEIMLRCELPDRPGALAALAGAIGEAGGDIEAVDVVETAHGRAVDDLVVVVEPADVSGLTARLARLPDVTVVHVGPSRGHPGDAVTRLAVGLEALLNGAMGIQDALRTLLGGLLRADSAEAIAVQDAPRDGDKVLVLAVDHWCVVLRRAYRFTATERDRAAAIARICAEAAVSVR